MAVQDVLTLRAVMSDAAASEAASYCSKDSRSTVT